MKGDVAAQESTVKPYFDRSCWNGCGWSARERNCYELTRRSKTFTPIFRRRPAFSFDTVQGIFASLGGFCIAAAGGSRRGVAGTHTRVRLGAERERVRCAKSRSGGCRSTVNLTLRAARESRGELALHAACFFAVTSAFCFVSPA